MMKKLPKRKKYIVELADEVIEMLEEYAKRMNGTPSDVTEEVLHEFLEDKYITKYDPLIDDVVEYITQFPECSAALIMRKFSVGYGRSQRILEQLVWLGYIEDREEGGPRKVLKNKLLQ